MADVISKACRSRVMAAVRSSGNRTTELRLAALFRERGITGWRRNQFVFGRPDFVFPRQKVAVFVDGCFWHGCRWHCRMPKSRIAFWQRKIASNKKRDQNVSAQLREQGWQVVRIWEHLFSNSANVVSRVQAALASGHRHM